MNISKAIYLSILFVIISQSCYSQKTADYYIPPEGPGFNILELFTSEGCSSCPAAEKAMRQLAKEYKRNFYTLEFHVDYWNHLGWKDEYSSKLYTGRQEHYELYLHPTCVYTPQVIINGSRELIGSAKAKMRPFLNINVLKEPTATLQVSATAHMSRVYVAYSRINTIGQVLNVALVQKKITNFVMWGENRGRKLTHTNVVRDFKTINFIDDHGFVEVYLPQGIVAEECSIIAYTQKKHNWEVTSVATSAITPENH